MSVTLTSTKHTHHKSSLYLDLSYKQFLLYMKSRAVVVSLLGPTGDQGRKKEGRKEGSQWGVFRQFPWDISADRRAGASRARAVEPNSEESPYRSMETESPIEQTIFPTCNWFL